MNNIMAGSVVAKLLADISPSQEAIAAAAYRRAEQRGFMPGGELGDWLDAERELRLESAQDKGGILDIAGEDCTGQLLADAQSTTVPDGQSESGVMMMDDLLDRTVLDSREDAILITDTAGVIQYANAVALDLVGVLPGEALGRPIHEILTLYDCATEQVVAAPLTFLMSLNDSEHAGGGYIQLIRRDGTGVAVDGWIRTIFASPRKPGALLLILRDTRQVRGK